MKIGNAPPGSKRRRLEARFQNLLTEQGDRRHRRITRHLTWPQLRMLDKPTKSG
jgi:hypothetical protein